MRLLSLLVLFSFYGYCQQENAIYFPQEQLIYPGCENSDDSISCLKDKISERLIPILKLAISQNNISVDTLTARVLFQVDKKGKILKDKNYTFINDSVLRKDYKKSLSAITNDLPKMKVINRKPKPYVSTHSIYYSFLVGNVNNSMQLNPIENEDNIYTGGVIEEVPLFPGCQRENQQKSRACFQKKMQKHITANFNYPKDAQAQGIQGKVSIMFIIDKNGDVINIKLKGPHSILTKEAERIIKLLPKFSPGSQNGKPVKVPYSIPIGFKLI